eukprot:TRINITY_DN16616_c0_g1_i1.p1 TRINITY_DN16616_c0_g1~~TRINITY_DN16616_c0_g1_i1.p1  ORF type:complete len:445 (-),score=82.13 TRINITY_DN16616_c0_g1_i1:64-1206(-)
MIGCEALARNRTVVSLNLSYNQLGGSGRRGRPKKDELLGIQHVAESIGRNNILKEVNLAGNSLGDEGMEHVCQMLQHNNSLESINLFNNFVTDAAVDQLCRALDKNQTLRRLNLDYNDITDSGAERLRQLLSTNTSLTFLSLKDNDGVSERWLRDISLQLERNQQIQEERRAIQIEEERRQKEEEERAEQERQERQRAIREERERMEREYQIMEEQRRREEEEELQRAKSEEERKAVKLQRKEEREKAQQEHLQNLVNLAYAWRATLHGGERRGREWRSGFQSVKDTEYGLREGYSPPAVAEQLAKRRLHACWCEPTEQTVSYAGTLHYHCVHEPHPNDLQLLEDGKTKKYQGCCATPHRCRSSPVTVADTHQAASLFAR